MNNIKTGYFEPDGTPRLRLSYCVYMDILGFTEIMSDAYKNKQGNSLLIRLHQIISLQAEELSPKPEPKLIPDNYAKLFTDNVVSGQIINSSDGESEFGFIILQILIYQFQMALAGFFVRGAITLGDLFIDDNIVLGPALVDAYLIEQTIARDPRIVLSDQVYKLVKSHMKFYGEPYDSPQNNHILIDSDGRPFVNYLSLLFEAPNPNYEETWPYLETHKQFIENSLIKYRKNPTIWSKYQWLSGYHNFFCKECSELPGYNERILINQKLAYRSPTRIVKSRTRKPRRIR